MEAEAQPIDPTQAAGISKLHALLASDPGTRRELALRSPSYFDSRYCGMRYAAHRECLLNRLVSEYVSARRSLRSPNPEKRKLLVLEPRDHGKTEAAITFCTQLICQDRGIRILLVGETADVGRKRLARIKSLLQSERIQQDWCAAPDEGYGPFLPPRGAERAFGTKWDESLIRVIRDVSHVDATAEAVGMRGAITGGHFDAIVVDDPETYQSVKSETVRRQSRTWLLATVLPMLAKGGLIVVIGTRKHHDDLYAHLLRKPDWGLMCEQAIKRMPDRAEPVWGEDEHGRQVIEGWDIEGDHEVLWPEERPLTLLLTEREGMRSDDGLSYAHFAREYQNEVTDEATVSFRRDWLDVANDRGRQLRLRRGPWPRTILWVQGWDPAFVTDERHAERADTDFAVGITWGADVRTRDRYLGGLHRERGDSQLSKKLNVIREYALWAPPQDDPDRSIVDHIRHGWVLAVAMEANNGGRFLAVETAAEDRRDIPLVARWTGAQVTDPYKGVPSLTALYERGKVLHPTATPEDEAIVAILCDELHGLGVARHDDTVSALWIAEVLLRSALAALDRYLEAEGLNLNDILGDA